MSPSFLVMTILVVTNESNDGQNPIIHQTDILNLHTYDFYDWFLLVSSCLVFGCICLCIGWIAQKKWIKIKQNRHRLELEMDENMKAKNVRNETRIFVELNDIESSRTDKKTLSPVYEYPNEEEFNEIEFPNTTPISTTSTSNTLSSMKDSLTKH